MTKTKPRYIVLAWIVHSTVEHDPSKVRCLSCVWRKLEESEDNNANLKETRLLEYMAKEKGPLVRSYVIEDLEVTRLDGRDPVLALARELILKEWKEFHHGN